MSEFVTQWPDPRRIRAVTLGLVSRRRIWSEFLPADELGSPATVALLERYSLEPLIALPPAAETGAMAEALAALGRAGVPVGLWPLLDDDQGYWPSEGNVAGFCTRVARARAFAARAGVEVATVAVDLQPPLAMSYQVRSGSMRARGHLFVDALRERQSGECAPARARAVSRFADLAAHLHRDGIETLAAVLPPVVVDLNTDTTLWQDLLRTPVVAPRWSVLSPLAYTSMLATLLPRPVRTHAHVVVYELGRGLMRATARVGGGPVPWRASLSLGMLGSGKAGAVATMNGPDELERDVASARAAGVDDLALFSLEGLLACREPEAWLLALTRTPPRAPEGISTRLLSSALRGAAVGAWGLSRALG